MAFVFFEDTFNSANGSEAAATSADLLLRLHGATLFTWVLCFWFAVPVLLAIATRLDGRFPVWFPGIGAVAALLQIAALSVTVAEGQWTTLSEMGLFRVGATFLIIFLLLQTLSMRAGSITNVTPGRAAKEEQFQ